MDPLDLPPPSGQGSTPRELVGELEKLVGAEVAAGWCADLLAGADREDYRAVFGYLGKNCAEAAFDARWPGYWRRTWGGRGLLYVWTDSAAPVLVQGLFDEAWRPAEMCLKAATLRQVGEAGPGAIPLTRHGLPRVRLNAVRCLGAVGDTEHVASVVEALDDTDEAVRRAAARALTAMARRLDLDVPDIQG